MIGLLVWNLLLTVRVVENKRESDANFTDLATVTHKFLVYQLSVNNTVVRSVEVLLKDMKERHGVIQVEVK